MHVAVIGAGIIGVTTAYELAADGHRVALFERHGTVAAEASFAHGGLVSAWTSPSAAAGRARWPWRSRSAVRPSGDDGAVRELLGYSRERLHDLTRRLRLDYERSDGSLLLWRTEAERSLAAPRLAEWAAAGVRFDELDAESCRAVEPGLSTEAELVGGVRFADDEAGNCRQFAHLLRQEAERLGLRVRFHTTVQAVEGGAEPRLTAVPSPSDAAPAREPQADFADTVPMADGPRIRPFDAVVVCAAMAALPLLRPLKLRLPLQAVDGHSITAPLRRNDLHPDLGPRSAVMDAERGIVISRLGQRVRVSGGSEPGGRADRIDATAIATLHQVLHDWFPGAAQVDQAQRWRGTRASLPDGLPLIGACPVPGVWLNLGHGDRGWALACGSARLLADRIAGRPTAIALDRLGLQRPGLAA